MLFVPRQVALSSLPAAAAMAKEEPRKEKKNKSKSKEAAKGSAAPNARRAAVVASVAAFLESSGFPRTLAALQSEASLEGDAWRSSPVSLEDLVTKFLDSSNSAPGAGTAVSNEQEETADVVAGEEDVGKKKKKKKGGAEVHEPESKALNTDDQKLDGKKKKSKKQEKDEDVEARLERVFLAVKNKFEAAGKLKGDGKKSHEEEPKSQNDGADKNGLGDGAPLDKRKNKKKSKSTSETSDKIDAGIVPAEIEGKTNGANENSGAVEKGKDDNEKKSKKKKKKSGSEENVLVEDKQVAGKDSVPKSDQKNRSEMNIGKGEDGRPSTDNAVVSKKRKLEEVEGRTLPAKEDCTDNQKLNNGFAEDDTKEHNTVSKPSKRQKLSSEPKTVIAFQRVKLDDVKFADERLQDNSYWAKGGADSGYGAKAQEILGQVRGRGFRHEKTKKKRGTYRGGLIDLQTHSIKFDNSDDE